MEALRKIQQELKAPKGQYNSFAKYNYRSCEDILEAVKPLLAKYGATLVLHDTIEQIGDRYYVKATATFMSKDDEAPFEVFAFAREPEEKRGMDDPQVTGTASSYARKYALNGLFLIDDTKDPDTDEYAKVTKKAEKKEAEAKADYKLSFQEVRDKLTAIDTIEDLNRYWTELHLSEKQANILKKDFADRKAQIGAD